MFGGLITVAVFIGFGYLLWSDVTVNLRDKLYSFEVRDKLMTAEKCGETELNFGTYNQSLNLVFGVDPDLPPAEKAAFDPLDNDYFRMVMVLRDTTEETLEVCGKPNCFRTIQDYEI